MTRPQEVHPFPGEWSLQAPGVGPALSLMPGDPAHLASILRSHERCSALGLARTDRFDAAPLIRTDLAVARERNRRLHQHAAPVMELLLELTAGTQSMVVLTDTHGTALHSVGHDGFLQRASKVALAPGVNWSEPCKGTNAIGTALMDETPTVVHGSEHFMLVNEFLTCSAAPIFDPRGNMLGVLDVSSDQRAYRTHTIGLVKMSARMIENHWLDDDFRQALRLHFHSRPDFIGTLMEGIVAVGHDGRFLGANRSALEQIGIGCAALRMNSLTGLLGTSVGVVVDHFRSPMAGPMQLDLPDGRRLYVRAAFNWPAWHLAGGVTLDADPAVPPAHPPSLAAGGPVSGPDGGARPPAASGRPVTGTAPAGLRYLQTGDAQMEAVVSKVRRVLDRDIPVLVLGETGSGKELLARAMHHDSDRGRQPFVAVNCASIPEGLIEAELFGYEDGAFTGARRKGAQGKIQQAHGGTLFLDEIGDMPLSLQARLLRVLQERQVSPLGSTKSVPVDVAVISATHRDLRAMISAQTFREDLYYRLNGLVVRLPALRERSDLLKLVRQILQTECHGRALELTSEVMAMLQRYPWPGNIRQLSTVLRTAAVMAAGESLITAAHLSDDFIEDVQREDPPWPHKRHSRQEERGSADAVPDPQAAAGATLESMEIQSIRRAIADADGNISVAARRLGISRNTVYRKLRGPGTPS